VLILAAAPDADHHDTGPRHPERAARVGAALQGLSEAGLGDAIVHAPERLASRTELELVHTPRYLDALQELCAGGGGHVDPDTPASRGSFLTAELAVGGGLAAIDALDRGTGDVAFVALRPPGHHALADQGMGFCLLNSVAVAASALAARGERVLIVDWDVHHGNGTQAIFWDDPRVLYVSTHQFPLYPGTGRADETGGLGAPHLTINVPLPAGATGDVLLRAMDDVVAPASDRFAPTWVLVSAGFDAHRADPLAGLALSAGDFADLARRVAAMASVPGRLALFLEGGCDLDALRMSVGATLAALTDVDFRPEPATSGGPGMAAVDTARRASS
jgi:acetoin utilization deacetylase AcuC-like enzyme